MLLSRAKRQHLNASDFSARFLEWSRRQRRRAWLVAPSERETLRSELPLGGHRSVLLDKQGADWRIVGGLFDYFPQDTPRTALMSLVRALSQKHTPALLRLMPRSFRRRWTKVSLAKALSTPMMAGEANLAVSDLNVIAYLGAPIFVNGTRAVMPYGNFRVRFELENGRWRIVDLD